MSTLDEEHIYYRSAYGEDLDDGKCQTLLFKGLPDQMRAFRMVPEYLKIYKRKSTGPFTPATCDVYIRRVNFRGIN